MYSIIDGIKDILVMNREEHLCFFIVFLSFSFFVIILRLLHWVQGV